MKCKRPTEYPVKGAKGAVVTARCNQCIGCLTTRREEWVCRMILETSQWPPGSAHFFTLTYSPECLPDDGSLKKRDMQLFWKRLRWNTGAHIRYFSCGEYGKKLARPHYHGICWAQHADMNNAILEAWNQGFVKVDLCNVSKMRYVAKYVTKSMRTPKGLEIIGDITANLKEPEFRLMSLRPGVGMASVSMIAESLKQSLTLNGRTRFDKNGKPVLLDTTILGMKHQGKWYPFDTYFKAKLQLRLAEYWEELEMLAASPSLERAFGKTPLTN